MKACKYEHRIESYKQLSPSFDDTLQKRQVDYKDLHNYAQSLISNMEIMNDLNSHPEQWQAHSPTRQRFEERFSQLRNEGSGISREELAR